MNFMINIAKEKNVYIQNPNEDDVNRMYKQICGDILSLNNNPRSDIILRKKKRNKKIVDMLYNQFFMLRYLFSNNIDFPSFIT